MYDEIYLRGYGEEAVNNEQENENVIEGWAFCAEPKTEPKEIVLFGDEEHWDEQHQDCPVCCVGLGEQHETWCSYQDE